MARKDGKLTLTVNTQFGTFTRTTARTYGFVIATRGYRLTRLRARREAYRKDYQRQLKDYTKVVETGRETPGFSLGIDAYRQFVIDMTNALETLDATFDETERLNREDAAGDMTSTNWAGKAHNADAVARSLVEAGFNEVRIFATTTGELVKTYGPFEDLLKVGE